jgi:3-phenylpropionate/cinnamic acid dioxygenase small subunit
MSPERVSGMELTADDRWAIDETIAMHGHLFDNAEFDRLHEIFTADVVYDVSDVGMGPLHGIAEILRAALELGAGNPVAHHVTNITVTAVENGCVQTRCKAIVVKDGRCGSATYLDTLRLDTDNRWKISHRIVLARRTPLNGAYAQPETMKGPGIA